MDHRKAERVGYQIAIETFIVLVNPRLEIEDPFCRCSIQKRNSAVTSIIKIP
jgi:hypothetical protein